MPTEKHLTDIITRHQVYLERVKSGLVLDFQRKLSKLTQMMRQIDSLLGDQELSTLSRAKLDVLLTKVEEATGQVMLRGIDEFMPDLEKLAGYESQFEAKAIRQAVRAVRLKVPSAKAAFKAALKQPLSATGKLLKPFIEDWSKTEVKAVSQLITKGFANGWTNGQLAQAIKGTKAKGYADGLVARIGRNADAVVRTSIQHVASTARMETWASNADVVEKYRWVSTLDGHTTPICRSLDGRVFELGKGPRPPIHIRCRSTTVAVVSDKFDFLDKGATRSSKDGYVNADLTYYEWLKQQPASFQDDVLGPARGKLLRDGGLSAERFATLNLNRNFEPLTLAEMKKKEPKAFERAGIELP